MRNVYVLFVFLLILPSCAMYEMRYDQETWQNIPINDQKSIESAFEAFKKKNYEHAFNTFRKYEGNSDHKFIQLALSIIYAEGLAGERNYLKALKLHIHRFFEIEIHKTEDYGKYNKLIYDVCNVDSETKAEINSVRFYTNICLFVYTYRRENYDESKKYLLNLQKDNHPFGYVFSGYMSELGLGTQKNISHAIESYYNAGFLFLAIKDKFRAQLQEDNIRRLDPNHPLLSDLQEYLYKNKEIDIPKSLQQKKEKFAMPTLAKDIEKLLFVKSRFRLI